MSLTIAQTRDDLLSKLGLTWATADDAAKQDVVVAMNGALQILQSAGEDYFTRERLTVTLSAGTATYVLASSVQAVVGPVKWNDSKPLRALGSPGEYDQFARLYLGESDYGVGADGDPMAYWVEQVRSGSTGDIVRNEIHLAPAPAVSLGTLSLEVINDAPAYAVANLTSTDAVPVAQNYTESIFLPIARMLVTRSNQFSRPELAPQLEADGQAALARLGFSGGFPPAAQPKAEREVTG